MTTIGAHGIVDDGPVASVAQLRPRTAPTASEASLDGDERRQGPNGPSCPMCGLHDTTSPYNGPGGSRYLCSCGSMFWGTDREWIAFTNHRQVAQWRRDGYPEDRRPEGARR